ncbi:MAG: sigma-70 family RNA polymerase sigma factor [Saprospiraceae bacterium]|nr:sigma-70 family RNA polymerase sigma factor [Saprospiraceae bacterium]
MKEKPIESFSDEEMIRMIQGKEEERHQALRSFFLDQRLERMVFAKIQERGGSKQDAQDAYQDAFKIFQRNVRNSAFEGRSSLRSYFVGIALRLWMDRNKQSWNSRVNLTDEQMRMEEQSEDNPLDAVIDLDRKNLVRQLLENIGERCKKILWLRANSHSMEEIAQEIGLSNADMAKKEAYRCNNRLKEMILGKPELVHLIKSMIHE